MVDEAYQVMLYIPFMLFDYLNIPNFAFVSIDLMKTIFVY